MVKTINILNKKILFAFIFVLALFGGNFFSISKAEAATLYFNGGANSDWGTLAGNWWTDAGHTSPAGALPGVADDVIIEHTIDSNSGPEASVNTFTTNGNFSILLTATVANGATFNGGTQNAGTLTGDATFNDSSYQYPGTINGNATFNDSSQLYSATVNGDATFNDSALGTFVIINGDVTFNGDNSSYVSGTVSGTKYRRYATNTVTTQNFTSNGPWTVVADGAEVDVTGATFNGATVFQTLNAGTFIGAPITLYWYSAGADNNWSTLTGNWWTDGGHSSQAVSLPGEFDTVTIVGGRGALGPSVDADTWVEPESIDASALAVTFTSAGGGGPTITIIGDAIFNGTSSNGGTVTGDAIFNDNSTNNGVVSGGAVFNDLSYNLGVVEGDAQFSYATAGVVTLSGEQVWGEVQGAITGSDAVPVSEYIFNDDSHTGVTIVGDATFNDDSYDSADITGDVVFNDRSAHQGSITGNATFNGSSINEGTVTGDGSFKDLSENTEDGTIQGNACFDPTATNNGTVLGTISACSGTPAPEEGRSRVSGSIRRVVSPSSLNILPCQPGDKYSTKTGLPCPSSGIFPDPSFCLITITLRSGSAGDQVKCLQIKLGLPSDGIFGPITKAGVIHFQISKDLIPDGVVGPKTIAKLFFE